jgi:hypothetical protein
MPPRRRAEERPGVRWQRQRAWGASIVIGGFVLFLWPFVRTPPLTIALSYAHLLGAWVAIIAGLFAMSRALAGERRRGDGDG